VLDPSVVRVSIAGDILSLPNPRTTLAKSFLPYAVSWPDTEALDPLRLGIGSSRPCAPVDVSPDSYRFG